MRTIYFNILFITLNIPLFYAQPGDPSCHPPDEGNWLDVFYDGTPRNTAFWKDRRIKRGKISDCNYFNLNETNVDSLYGFINKTFFLGIKDSINISFETVQGNVDIVLVNKNILSDTLPSRFFISDLPRMSGKYIIDLHRDIEEPYINPINPMFGFCGYNITPKDWYEHLIDSPCEKNSKVLNSNGTLIVSYNLDFDEPLEDGQFIALDSLNSENNKKPYVVIEGVLDSLKKITDKSDMNKINKDRLYLEIVYKVYTDKGTYIVKINSTEFTEYPESLGCFFVSICDIDEILGHYNKFIQERNEKDKDSPNYIEKSLIKSDNFHWYPFHFHKDQETEQSNYEVEDDGNFSRYQLYYINERCCKHLIHVDFD